MSIDEDIIELMELLLEANNQQSPPSFNMQANNKEVALEMREIIRQNKENIQKLKKKLAKLDSEINNNNLESTTNHNFRQELIRHTEKFDFLKLLLVTGDTYCDIKGVAFRVYEDFIILLANDNRLIKVPFNKIAAVEKQKYSKKKSSLNATDNNELTEARKKEIQEKIASLAKAKN